MLRLTVNPKCLELFSRQYTNDQPHASLEDAHAIAAKRNGWDIEIVTVNYIILANENKEAFDMLVSADGSIIPDGFGDLNVETKVVVAQYAWMNNIPFLGICLGIQIMVIEFARNVLGFREATTEEFSPLTGDFAIRKHPNIICSNTNEDIFLGEYSVEFGDIFSSKIQIAKNASQIFRHRYSHNPIYVNGIKNAGVIVDGRTDYGRVVASCVGANNSHESIQ